MKADRPSQLLERFDGPMPDPAKGVFETTLVVDGRPVALAAHLRRLEASLAALYGEALRPAVGARVAKAAGALPLGRVRVTMSPGNPAAVRSVAVNPALVFPGEAGGVELAAVTVPGGLGAHKWADRRLLELAEARLAPRTPVVVDTDGTVLEGSRGSLFLVRAGRLSTPPADGRLLPGVTRAQVIAVAGALGIEVREEPVDLAALSAADEAFLTGAVRGVEPVRSLAPLAEWNSGEVTSRVAAELRRIWLS